MRYSNLELLDMINKSGYKMPVVGSTNYRELVRKIEKLSGRKLKGREVRLLARLAHVCNQDDFKPLKLKVNQFDSFMF